MSDNSPKDATEGITIRVTTAQLRQIAERLGVVTVSRSDTEPDKRRRRRKQRGRTRGRG